MHKNYIALSRLRTFEERFNYLKLANVTCENIFGESRYLNQKFYQSRAWKRVRDRVILRDDGLDLGCDGYYIAGKIVVHHMNPITIDDLEVGDFEMLNPRLLICVSEDTHRAIHYGVANLTPRLSNTRSSGDTTLW